MTAPVLRAYQTDIVTEFYRSLAAGQKKVLLVAPTAAGKTVIMAAIIARAVANQKRVLVIAHRREIISLTSRKLHDREVRHGIIRAGDEKKLRPTAAVQVASIQTLHARAIRSSTMRMPLACASKGATTSRRNSPSAWTVPNLSATSSATGTGSASAEGPWPSHVASGTPSIFAMNSSAAASEPSTSTDQPQTTSVTLCWRGSRPAKLSSFPTAKF